MPTNSDISQTSTGNVALGPVVQAAAAGIADDGTTIASAEGALAVAPAPTGGNATLTVVTVSASGATVVEVNDSIDVVTVGAPGGNDGIAVLTTNNDAGLSPLTRSVASFIDDGAEGVGGTDVVTIGVGGTLTSGGNDTITIDDGPPSSAGDVIPGDGSFVPLEPGDAAVDILNGNNGTLGFSAPAGGVSVAAPAPDDGDPVSADVREAPLIIRDPPIDDGRGIPPVGNGAGDAGLAPIVRVGAPLPPLLDPDEVGLGTVQVTLTGGAAVPPPVLNPGDVLDAGLGTVEVTLPPAAMMPPGVDVPPPVLDNGLTMIAEIAPAAGNDDSLTILAATA